MITLEANYSKKIGLPGYSSHQFSVTLKSELSDVSKVEQESARLYDVLQTSVDQNIQQVGFLPSEAKSNGHSSSQNGNGHQSHQRGVRPVEDPWKCSQKQKEPETCYFQRQGPSVQFWLYISRKRLSFVEKLWLLNLRMAVLTTR
jgi:hypothetical protein